ncbi:MAG: FtsX-like permease family protein [bacterium]
MKFEEIKYIAKKFSASGNNRRFLNFARLVALISVVLGSMALIISLSVLDGFESALKSNAVKFTSHIRLKTFDNKPINNYNEVISKIRKVSPNIEKIAPVIEKESLLSTKSFVEGVVVRGTNPELDITNMKNNIIEGRFSFSGKTSNEICIGKRLAKKLNAKIGDAVVIYAIQGDNLSQMLLPAIEKFKLTGIYETGMAQYDDIYVYIPFNKALELFKLSENSATSFDIMLYDIEKAGIVAEKLNKQLGFMAFTNYMAVISAIDSAVMHDFPQPNFNKLDSTAPKMWVSEFMNNNQKNNNVITLSDELQYKILKEGKGNSPDLGDYIKINIIVKILDNNDTNDLLKEKKLVTVKLTDEILSDWQKVIPLMKKGSKYIIYSLPGFVLDENESQNVSLNKVIIYEIELIDFQKIPLLAITVFDLHSAIFAWIEMQKAPIPLVLGLISIVAVLNIITILLITVVEKTHSIGILKALGMSRRNIIKIFIIQGLSIGIIGTIIGCSIGLLFGLIQQNYGIISLEGEIYFLDKLPVEFEVWHFAVVCTTAIVLSFLATLIPSFIASSIKPIRAIRFK